MSFGDISARMKKAKAKKNEEEKGEDRPFDFAESYRLRAKMLGVLIRDARLDAARTIEDCARLLSVEPRIVEAWEYGDAVPSLPQLELLAYYLDVPVSHFWVQETLEHNREVKVDTQMEFQNLRNRMIGALLRQAREEKDLSLEAMSEEAQIPAANLQAYEVGELPVPMHELTVLAGIVDQRIQYFLESSGQIGELLEIREEWKRFTDLDEEIRRFAANPLNIGFIKIAIMFSKMSTEQLREVAEGMLEITH